MLEKIENFYLFHRWKEYAGPIDERLQAQDDKIYHYAFNALAWGVLIAFIANVMRDTVIMQHDLDVARSLILGPLGIWLAIVCWVAIDAEAKAGISFSTRPKVLERVPWNLFALVSGLTAVGVFLVIFASRTLAEVELVGVEQVSWGLNAVAGLVLSVANGLAVFAVLGAQHAEAKRERDRAADALED